MKKSQQRHRIWIKKNSTAQNRTKQHRKKEKEEELCMLCCVWIDLFGEFLKRVFYHSVCVHGLKWVRDFLCTVPFHIYSPFTHKYTLTHTKRDFDTSTLPFLHIHTLPVAALIVQKHQTKQFNWHYNNNTRTSAKIDDIYCVQFFCCLFFESEKCADQYRNWNHSSLLVWNAILTHNFIWLRLVFVWV